MLNKNFIENLFVFIAKIEMIWSSKRDERVKLSQLELISDFLVHLDGYIKYYFYSNFIFLLGLFINFIFSLKFLFKFSNQYNYAIYGNLYLLLYILEVIIFMILVIKYLKFIFKWTNLKKRYLSSNNHSSFKINELLSELKRILPEFYYDKWRYVILLIFLLLVFSRSWIEAKYPFNVNPKMEMGFLSILLIISLMIWVEWPSYRLWKEFKNQLD